MAASFRYSTFLCFLLSSSFIFETATVTTGSPAHQINGACSSQGIDGSGLIVHHRYGPFSGLPGQKPTGLDLLSRDKHRVSWIQSRVHNSHTGVQREQTTIPATMGNGDYTVTVGFGTPKRNMTLEFDTGSDLTWIQCKPCTGSCYKQQDPIFDPTHSSSYHHLNLPCNSAECNQLNSRSSRCSSTCKYEVGYGDQSKTTGTYAHETLTLTPSVALPGFLFGCGHDNVGFKDTAGLLGLGRATESIVTQTARKYKKVFSYCLPSSEKVTGYLTFGQKNVPKGVRYTPLVTGPNIPSGLHTLYPVELTGISVNGKKLVVAASTFKGGGGTIVDSGTTYSRLPPAAYKGMLSPVRKAMRSTAIIVSGFECYAMRKKVVVPKITLHMKGVDMELEEERILLPISKRLRCVAFLPLDSENETAIIGNYQQKTFTVVYDIPKRRIGFAAGGCA